MEIGKWIVFAFLLGAVLVGFKSRQLKAYEFIICGLFMVLLDGLVFHGAISRWVGEAGNNAKNAVSMGDLPAQAALGLALPISTPTVRRFARACWKHRPGSADLIVVAVCAAVVAGVLNLSVLVTGAVFTGTLVGLVTLAAATDPAVRNPRSAKRDNATDSTGAADERAPGSVVKPAGGPNTRERRDG